VTETAPSAVSEQFNVALPDFKGPMDLLVYLVKLREIDVAMISVSQLAEDYLAWWRSRLEQLDFPVAPESEPEPEADGWYKNWCDGINLDQAGEFILLAAILLEYKAVSLLPEEEPTLDGLDLGEKAEWSPEELAMFQVPAGHLAELESKQVNLFDRGVLHVAGLAAEITSDMFSDVAVYDLALAFSRLTRDLPPEPQHTVERIPYTIEGQTGFILSFFANSRKITFDRLAESMNSRLAVVVTFLALLELIRTGRVTVLQNQTFGQLWIIRLEPNNEQ